MSSVASTMAVLNVIRFGKKKNKTKLVENLQTKNCPSLEFQLEADEFVKNIKVEHSFPRRGTKQGKV